MLMIALIKNAQIKAQIFLLDKIKQKFRFLH